jgi:hypothetical protein
LLGDGRITIVSVGVVTLLANIVGLTNGWRAMVGLQSRFMGDNRPSFLERDRTFSARPHLAAWTAVSPLASRGQD